MPRLRRRAIPVLWLFSWWCCAVACDDGNESPAPLPSGTFSLLTYNVAGLPEGISGSRPEHNTPLMSPLLNDYDVVLVQEDFAYHEALISEATHADKSSPDPTQEALGDGLNVLSRYPLGPLTRTAWADCFGEFDSGSDCLTPKGFFRVRLELGQEAFLDVYNLHADAGRSPADAMARAGNFEQLLAALLAHSADHALIIAGDFNERYTYPDQTLASLLTKAGLKDVWVELERASVLPSVASEPALECATDEENPMCERIDKILYRSSERVSLTPSAYRVDAARFVDEAGVPLSDHPPVVADFTFNVQ